MSDASLDLKSPRIILRLANQEDVPEIVAYYAENKGYLAPFEPLRSPAFYTESY